MKEKKEHINPEGLFENPAFSQVVSTQGNGKTLYIGGQNAVNRHAEIVGKDDIAKQTEQVMNNLDIAYLILSGYSIHHIDHSEKQRLYQDIFSLLNPGGLFLNLEHVSSSSEILEETFDEFFLDGMSDYQKHIGREKTRDEVKEIIMIPTIRH